MSCKLNFDIKGQSEKVEEVEFKILSSKNRIMWVTCKILGLRGHNLKSEEDQVARGLNSTCKIVDRWTLFGF